MLYTWYRPSLQPVTAEYEVEFDPRVTPPYVIGVDVSQAVEPHGTDRFVLRVAHAPDFDWFVHNVLVWATIRLVYNEQSETTEPLPLLFTVRPRWQVRAVRKSTEPIVRQKLAANRRVLDDLLAAPGKTSASIDELRAQVKKGAWPDAATLGITPTDPPQHPTIRVGTAAAGRAKQRLFRR